MVSVLGSSAMTTGIFLLDMNALLHRFHNFVLLLMRGRDRICACTCGRHQVYHVIPYNEAQSMVASRENYFLSDIMTRQEMDLVVGLLLGLCISWFLLRLDRVWLKYCDTAKQMNDVGFWPWMPKFSNTKDLFMRLYPKHRGLRGEHGAHQARCVP